MIDSSIADIVGPAVAAKRPYRFFYKIIDHGNKLLRIGGCNLRKRGFRLRYPFALGFDELLC